MDPTIIHDKNTLVVRKGLHLRKLNGLDRKYGGKAHDIFNNEVEKTKRSRMSQE
jgi:hypothetical protein